jgi:hypothetical protein
MQLVNSDAKLAASSRPVTTTEIGWDSVDPVSEAKYVLDAAMDSTKNSDAKTCLYALFDEGSGDYGLMNPDGTPQAAGTALQNVTTLLADNGTNSGSFAPGFLDYI